MQGLQYVFHDAMLTPRDMQGSFFIVAGVTLCSALIFVQLAPNAGAEVSGRLPAPANSVTDQASPTANAPAE